MEPAGGRKSSVTSEDGFGFGDGEDEEDGGQSNGAPPPPPPAISRGSKPGRGMGNGAPKRPGLDGWLKLAARSPAETGLTRDGTQRMLMACSSGAGYGARSQT